MKFYGRFGYDTNTHNSKAHLKWPDMWKAQNKRNSFGELEFTKVENEHLMSIPRFQQVNVKNTWKLNCTITEHLAIIW